MYINKRWWCKIDEYHKESKDLRESLINTFILLLESSLQLTKLYNIENYFKSI